MVAQPERIVLLPAFINHAGTFGVDRGRSMPSLFSVWDFAPASVQDRLAREVDSVTANFVAALPDGHKGSPARPLGNCGRGRAQSFRAGS